MQYWPWLCHIKLENGMGDPHCSSCTRLQDILEFYKDFLKAKETFSCKILSAGICFIWPLCLLCSVHLQLITQVQESNHCSIANFSLTMKKGPSKSCNVKVRTWSTTIFRRNGWWLFVLCVTYYAICWVCPPCTLGYCDWHCSIILSIFSGVLVRTRV